MSISLPPRALRAYSWNGTPLVVRDVVVLGSSMTEQDSAARMTGVSGDVYGFDVRTGQLRWTFRPIPRAGEPGIETWENESWRYTGAANVWAPMSGDEELGYVYLPTSSATNDMYGGHRLGANLFSSSIVCLDAATGKRVWHFQTVHHDLFDYDNPAAPILADITSTAADQGRRPGHQAGLRLRAGSRDRPARVAHRGASGAGLDGPRRTSVADAASSLQAAGIRPPGPYGGRPDRFHAGASRGGDRDHQAVRDRPGVHPAIDRRPGAQDKKGTIQMPGSVGGADWTGAAFDRETGMLYVPSMTNPFVANLLPGDPARTDLRYRASTRQLIQGPQGLPLTKPPYGRITALNLNRGEQAWMVANGDGPRNHPLLKPLNLPPLGQSVRAAPLVTKTLLFVSEGDQVNVRTPPNGGGKKLRAFDKATGEGRVGNRAPRRHDGNDDDLPGQGSAVPRRGDRRPESPARIHRVRVDRADGFDSPLAGQRVPEPPPVEPPAHARRRRYPGKNPREFHDKYKELNPERYPADVGESVPSGKTPAGMHLPIMVEEVLRCLRPGPGDVAVDCTLGGGGHARAILERVLPGGRLIGLDVDPLELPRTEARLRAAGFGPDVFVARHANFAGLPKVLAAEGLTARGPDPGRPRRVVDAVRQSRSRLQLQRRRSPRHADESAARRARVAADRALERRGARAACSRRTPTSRTRRSSPAC